MLDIGQFMLRTVTARKLRRARLWVLLALLAGFAGGALAMRAWQEYREEAAIVQCLRG